jgi:hypothetical protein
MTNNPNETATTAAADTTGASFESITVETVSDATPAVTPGSTTTTTTPAPAVVPNIESMLALFNAASPADPAERVAFYLDMERFLETQINSALAAPIPPAGPTPVSSNVHASAPATTPLFDPFAGIANQDPLNTTTGPFGDLDPLQQPTHGNPVGANIDVASDVYRPFTPITHGTTDGNNAANAPFNNGAADSGNLGGTNPSAFTANANPSSFNNVGSSTANGSHPAAPEISTPLRPTSLAGNPAATQENRSYFSDSRPGMKTTYTIHLHDPQHKPMLQQITQAELFTEIVPNDPVEMFLRSCARKLAMDDKVRESRRIASRKSTVNVFCHIDPMDLHKLNVEKSGALSNVDRVLFQLQSKLDEFGFQHLFRIHGTEAFTTSNGRNKLQLTSPHYSIDMLANHGYKSLSEAFVMNYVTYLTHFAFDDHEEDKLIKEEMHDSFHLVMNSCDSYLRGQIEHELSTRPDYYKPHHQSGPVALFLALRFITITSPHEIRLLINQLVSLKLTNVQGEDITFFLGQCRTLINRIVNPLERTTEFFEIILDALNECTVAKFTSDLAAWCSARDIDRSIREPKNHHDLMTFATQRYQDMVTVGRWLPTSKGKLSYFTAATKDKKPAANDNKKKAKPAPATQPAAAPAASTPATTSAKNKRTFPAWRTTPPGPGELVKWNKDQTRSFKWCGKCALWTNHDDSGHKSKEVLEAERAARAAASPSNPVSFSAGTAPKSQS